MSAVLDTRTATIPLKDPELFRDRCLVDDGVGALADLWTTWLAMATGTAKAEAPRQETGKNFEDMMASFLSPSPGLPPASPAEASPPTEPPAPEAATAPAPEGEAGPEPNPFKAWGEIMEKGHEMQRQHLASLQTIIDGVGLMGHDDHTVKETADLTTLPSQTKRMAVLLYRVLKNGPPK